VPGMPKRHGSSRQSGCSDESAVSGPLATTSDSCHGSCFSSSNPGSFAKPCASLLPRQITAAFSSRTRSVAPPSGLALLGRVTHTRPFSGPS
jgi:hypothetical protein